VRRRLDKPRATVDRQLQALQFLKLLTCEEEEAFHQGKTVTHWCYQLAAGIDPSVLVCTHVPDLSAQAQSHTERESRPQHTCIYLLTFLATLPPSAGGTTPAHPANARLIRDARCLMVQA
jgi:hypothetical protein